MSAFNVLVLRRLFLPLGVLIALLTAVTAPLLRRYVVEGRSMLRAYAPGDRLLVERLTYRLREPRVGDAVIVRQPGTDGRLDLKRIAAAQAARSRCAASPPSLATTSGLCLATTWPRVPTAARWAR